MGTPVCLNSTLAPSRVLRGDTTQPQQSHVEMLALDSASKNLFFLFAKEFMS